MAEIKLNRKQVIRTKKIAGQVSLAVGKSLKGFSTLSVERAVLRLYGVDDVNNEGMPIPNLVVEHLKARGELSEGVSRAFARAVIVSGKDPQKTAELLVQGKIDIEPPNRVLKKDIRKVEKELARAAILTLERSRKSKQVKKKRYAEQNRPLKYLIVATGNINEDVKQAASAVYSGADIIAVIRSTAQSLLDYVPYGLTTEGVGGTYATQENFKIMRAALDAMSE
ncbi:MAG: lysine 5,6-aminomutase subunit alpha TIM-barrel domain-containing protein, partial [Nitrospinota bacterium]